jgi:hypothetical protein
MNTLRNSFPGQEQNEAIYVFARPYFVSFLPTTLVFVFIFGLALLFQFLIAEGLIAPSTTYINQLIVLGLGIFQLMALIVFMVTLVDFYFDIVIITDRRLVDIDQEQLFYRRVSGLALENVEDVSAVIQGFFPTLFSYGTVEVQTAGEQNKFIIENLQYPREIGAIIQDLSEQAKRGINEDSRVPESSILGVISGKKITSWEELTASGAALPTDMRRYRREGPPRG